jgi:hypothetical protein
MNELVLSHGIGVRSGRSGLFPMSIGLKKEVWPLPHSLTFPACTRVLSVYGCFPFSFSAILGCSQGGSH